VSSLKLKLKKSARGFALLFCSTLIINKISSTTFAYKMVESKITEVPQGYRSLTEGQANILYIESKLVPDADNMVKTTGHGKRQANEVNENRGAVFYNPVQEFNRDFSIMAIN
jgi:hypothetical protein